MHGLKRATDANGRASRAKEATSNYTGSATALEWSAQLSAQLVAWYNGVRRPLPWRATTDPWAILLSEIMCQQTRAEVAVPYYHRFLERFPTYRDMAASEVNEVVAMWSGLGYYSRARNLHRCSQELVRLGAFPENFRDLLKLPGVGEYTAAALMSMAFAQPCLPFDGNLQRVFSRYFALAHWSKNLERALREAVEPQVPPALAVDFSNALMELGATLCRPNGSPDCPGCPLTDCRLRHSEEWVNFPARKLGKRTQELTYWAIVAADNQGVYLCEGHPLPFLRGLLVPPLLESAEVESISAVEFEKFTPIGQILHGITFRKMTVNVWLSPRPVEISHWPTRSIGWEELTSLAVPSLTAKILQKCRLNGCAIGPDQSI